jgi:hypothetical protein
MEAVLNFLLDIRLNSVLCTFCLLPEGVRFMTVNPDGSRGRRPRAAMDVIATPGSLR